MRKITAVFLLVMMLLSLVSCDIVAEMINPDRGDNKPPEGNVEPGDNKPVNPDEDDNSEDKKDNEEDTPSDNINPELIRVGDIRGLNEQIWISLTPEKNFKYKILYKLDGDTDYLELDSELMIASENKLDCYILGIKKGNYTVKIEAENDNTKASRVYEDVFVDSQDRSGYAHFGAAEGIGAYNNDGTVKEGTTILYVTNENKNTLTMTINGVEYVGLVDIMQKLFQCDNPVLIRVIGTIYTNQWNYKNVEPRLTDGLNNDPTFFENTFSTEYGENLANLKVRYSDKKAGKTYTFKTTPTGLGEVRVGGSGISTTSYKGSDFPKLYGNSVYDDDSYINVIEVQAASNVTIEGVGSGAEFFQFGIGFEECNSIEVKNLTFTNYPEDALNFMGKDMGGLENSGRYWIHNNTFNKGYNAWDITGERDKYAGDGTIDMAFIHGVTVAYNKFDSCKKTMLVGNSDSVKCLNISLHHNYFYQVGSRIPLTRGTNVHSYNNYFNGCSTCSSIRVNTYLFSEANFYNSCKKPFDLILGAVKSYGDVFKASPTGSATIASSRDQIVANSCKPDGKTDYSRFDTNSDLFYYDEENKCSDVEVMLKADDVPAFVLKYVGAGVMSQLVLDDYN